jgi:hypothetical protein
LYFAAAAAVTLAVSHAATHTHTLSRRKGGGKNLTFLKYKFIERAFKSTQLQAK